MNIYQYVLIAYFIFSAGISVLNIGKTEKYTPLAGLITVLINVALAVCAGLA
jgi:hypothetical protein